MSPDRTRRVGQVAALAALALLASACTGTTPTAGHPRHRDRPSPAQTDAAPTSPPPASSPAAPTTAPTTAPPSSAPADPCATAQLSVSLKPAGVAAGSTYQRLVFTNTGSAACALTGFPGVSYVTHRDGSQVGAAAERMGSTHTVSLGPGGSAAAVLQSTDARNYPEDKCGQTTAAGLRVYPPNETTALFVRDRALTCADSSVQVLHIGSVRAG